MSVDATLSPPPPWIGRLTLLLFLLAGKLYTTSSLYCVYLLLFTSKHIITSVSRPDRPSYVPSKYVAVVKPV